MFNLIQIGILFCSNRIWVLNKKWVYYIYVTFLQSYVTDVTVGPESNEEGPGVRNRTSKVRDSTEYQVLPTNSRSAIPVLSLPSFLFYPFPVLPWLWWVDLVKGNFLKESLGRVFVVDVESPIRIDVSSKSLIKIGPCNDEPYYIPTQSYLLLLRKKNL